MAFMVGSVTMYSNQDVGTQLGGESSNEGLGISQGWQQTGRQLMSQEVKDDQDSEIMELL